MKIMGERIVKVISGHGVWVTGCPSTNTDRVTDFHELSLRCVKSEMPVGQPDRDVMEAFSCICSSGGVSGLEREI